MGYDELKKLVLDFTDAFNRDDLDADEAVDRAIPGLDDGARLLDYGAGTGLLAQSMATHVGSLTLVDTSSGMREVMARPFTNGTPRA